MADKYAGILLFRRKPHLQLLLGHPGGPYWNDRDEEAWLIPLDKVENGEKIQPEAKRVFSSKMGFIPEGKYLPLGSASNNGDSLHLWAVDHQIPDDFIFDPVYFETEWPPESGKQQAFPEIDRIEYFAPFVARTKIQPFLTTFISRLILECSR